jgi:hypothetical protein
MFHTSKISTTLVIIIKTGKLNTEFAPPPSCSYVTFYVELYLQELSKIYYHNKTFSLFLKWR